MKPTSESDRALVEAATRQLAANRRRGFAPGPGLSFDYVCPSIDHYPFQWFWDSCFHAIALCHVDQSLGEQEIICLLQGARPDGFIPHVLFWEAEAQRQAIASYNLPPITGWTSTTIQTPVLATAVRHVWEHGGSRSFLERSLPPTLRYYDWLAEHRDPDGDGLISILQPDESGLDASPKYDAALGLEEPDAAALRAAMDRLFALYADRRGDDAALLALGAFDVEDVMVNSVYADALEDLAALLDQVGEDEAAVRCQDRAGRCLSALLRRSWDPGSGAFWDLWRNGDGEQAARVLTVTSLFPLLLRGLPDGVAAALHATLVDSKRFWTRYPCPSVAMSEPSYNPGEGILWRGPTWLNTNWFLVRGLRRHGFDETAAVIASASRELVRLHGFREYYHPETGVPGGAHGFGWSTLVVDM